MAGGKRPDTTAKAVAPGLMTRWLATRRGRLGLWALWVAVTAAGPTLGTALGLISGLPRWPQIILILAVSIAGIATGQWLVLRRLTARVRGWAWWTAGGLALGALLFLALLAGLAVAAQDVRSLGGPEVMLGECRCTYSPPDAIWMPDCCACSPLELGTLAGMMLLGAFSGAAGGASAGLLQIIPLRRWLGHTPGWVWAASLAGVVVGILVGLTAVGFVAVVYYDGAAHVECSYRWAEWIGSTTGPAGGLLLGGLTGIALVRVLARAPHG